MINTKLLSNLTPMTNKSLSNSVRKQANYNPTPLANEDLSPLKNFGNVLLIHKYQND